jgi:RimJ/RimL family protein N-acetyltransferase
MELTNLYIETKRLVIRGYQHEDYEDWIQQYAKRLPSQNPYDEGKIEMGHCTREWFYNTIEKHRELTRKDDVFIFGVFRKEDGVNVGYIDFSTLLRLNFQWARIGYNIHNHFWRQGYGSEAVRGAILIGFEQLYFHRIEAHINLDNEASIRLAESVGMEFEGIRKGFVFEHDQWVDHRIYSIQAKTK